jgi:hypothetical protein
MGRLVPQEIDRRRRFYIDSENGSLVLSIRIHHFYPTLRARRAGTVLSHRAFYSVYNYLNGTG